MMISCSLLASLKPSDKFSWMVIGDFNEIMFHYEKRGGLQKRETFMSNFRMVVDNNELYDLVIMEILIPRIIDKSMRLLPKNNWIELWQMLLGLKSIIELGWSH